MIRDAAIVRAVRKREKITQDALADKAKLSEVTIRRFERADETVEIPTRAAIATALGLDFDWDKECVIAPKSLPEGAISWAMRQLLKRRKGVVSQRNVAGANNKMK